MAIFPDDIIIEILIRLPVKSLIRFRCVSKPWCNLIHDSTFIQTHFKRALEENNLDLFISCTTTYKQKTFFSHMYCLDFNSSNEAVEIIENPIKESLDEAFLKERLLGSCNGLVCLFTTDAFCVLNPLTREFKFVNHDFDVRFEYEDVYGFGFDSDAGVYAVVYIKCDHIIHSNSIVHVYSLSDTSTTCVITFNVAYKFKCDMRSGVYLNGALHWVAFPNPMDKRNETVVSFNINEKVFQELPRPDKLTENACITVGLLGGYISILCYLPSDPIEIWIMNNYGVKESWSKLCAIERAVIPCFMASDLWRSDPWVRP
ncbi:hypothetical protein AQUCO_00700358v1 [Aquilegia coerulea]|uniref:F-box domain-containing protein n=1 Tax=Aquilegia coerulea TaxID=218851 RepID=A0A2G5EJT1_AQUCA|nr:hypothetical protein AQUCO_00700358v1 [Aquilegia coerulea]